MSVYSELIRIGIKEDEAGKIAESTYGYTDLVTKQDLAIAIKDVTIAIKELEATLAWRVIAAMVALTGIFAAIVKLT